MAQRKPTATTVRIRGQEHRVLVPLSWVGADFGICLALLTLDNPQVDEVLTAMGFTLSDVDGVRIWPPDAGPPAEGHSER